MSNPYREPYRFEEKKESKLFKMLTKIGEFVGFILFRSPIGFCFGLIGIVAFAAYMGNRLDDARHLHAEHDTYVLRQQICAVHHGWYTPSENLQTLVACHRLSNHELFYVFQTTGLELMPESLSE